MSKYARDVYSICSEKVLGTEYEELVFPRPKTAKDREWDKYFESELNKYDEEKMKRYEDFFNNVVPHIDWDAL